MRRTFEDFKKYVGTEQRGCSILECYIEGGKSFYKMKCLLCDNEFGLYVRKAFIGKCNPCRCERDLSGQTFGELYVFSKIDKTGKWACRCSCGGLTAATRPTLLRSSERDYPASCGCMKRAMNPLFSTYNGMLQRCNNPKLPGYKNYGGRGIGVCDRWSDPIYGFRNFIGDMAPKPEGLTLDRVDNNQGYSPENCRWTDLSTQNRNQRTAIGKTSAYRGVSWFGKPKFKWRSQIGISGEYRNKLCGYFDDEVEAAKAYDKAAREMGYEESWLNFPKT